jgi:hypothetical protein
MSHLPNKDYTGNSTNKENKFYNKLISTVAQNKMF